MSNKDARFDIVVVSEDPEMQKRVQGLCAEFEFNYDIVRSVDELVEKHESSQVGFVLLSTGKAESKDEAAGLVQVTKQILQDAFLFVAVGKKLDAKAADWIKKSGADVVVLENEIYQTSKLDFISVQRLKTAYMPVKATDFKVGQQIPFNIYYLLPQNKKFMPVVHKDMTLDEKRVAKLNELGELYVKRPDLQLYNKHLMMYPDKSAAGLTSRCRALFLLLSTSYGDMVMEVTAQSENASYDTGKEILDRIYQFSNELLTNLMSVGKVWEIVNSSAIGDFGSIERGPTRAAYAGYLSLMGGIGKPEDMMMASLFADIGLVMMPQKLIKKIREDRMAEFDAEELMEYKLHPMKSLNLALGRKLQISQEIRNGIQFSHARFDKKGFPTNIMPDKITVESFLTQFCQILDDRCQVKMGKTKPEFKDEFKKLVTDHDSADIFGFGFLNEIKKIELI